MRIRSMYSDAVKELTVLRRAALVNRLYGGWKLAVEDLDATKTAKTDEAMSRSDS